MPCARSPPGGQLFERATEHRCAISAARSRRRTQAAAQEIDARRSTEERARRCRWRSTSRRRPRCRSSPRSSGRWSSPLATAGIVIVFVIFMLLKRDDLRDRVIRLAGSRDLPRTTQALDDAARRVGRYLLMQLVVNTTYAIPIGIGLWLIGIPNPVLWATALRDDALRPLYRPDRRGVLSAGARHRRRSGLDDAAPDRRALHRRRARQQQLHGAVALRREHRPLADRDHRLGGLLDLALGTGRPAPFDAAHRLPRRARPARAAVRLPRRAARRRAGAFAAGASLPAAPRRRSRTRRRSARRNSCASTPSTTSTTRSRSPRSRSRRTTARRCTFRTSSGRASPKAPCC